ncbi:MAG: hypothetical protein WAX12_11660 [Candidatus Microthrix subdominans]|mgnify:FL=1|jgi:uncharacterized membrane protein YtjA (UPF0391 family)|nr:hypothetical protein [Candidatus Microthrix sp.]MBK9559086.1 hypothetical protein [Candidatus Microthrix sp.]MBP7595413.1 hypothetical protein [Candidatus Microthrix sp.]MBP9064656.1 hypothetical protein [Candidatus Microthrix sp.]
MSASQASARTTGRATASAPTSQVRGGSQRPVGRAAVAPPDRSRYKRSGGIAAYLLVMVSLQIFLLVVAVEGVLAHEGGLARAAAGLSVALWLIVVALRRLMPHE